MSEAITTALEDAIAELLADGGDGLKVLGVCGAQGSGKSTLARMAMTFCAAQGIAAATLSLDDIYLTRAERGRLGREVHPLLATRGVPGTHDVALGLDIIAALDCGEPAPLPRFDKAADDRLPASDWHRAPQGCRLLVFEGWCVGARPQPETALAVPVNELEAVEDADGVWRRFANDALAGDYQRLFARVDHLVMLAAPSFEIVRDWRQQQEDELRARAGPDAPGVMDPREIARFIQHYERLTRHMLTEMPTRADLVIELDEERGARSIRSGASPR